MCQAYDVGNLKSKLNFSNFFTYSNRFDIFFIFETHVVIENRNNFCHYFKDYILFWEDAKNSSGIGRVSGGCLYGFKKAFNNSTA